MMTCNLKPPLANWLRLCLCCAALALLLPPSIAATLTTDKPDYPPYSNVYITGAGFQAGETVTVHLDRVYPDGARAPVWDAAPPPLADATGSFTVTWYIDSTDYIGATLDAIATGLSSGFAANATFTDAGYYIEAWSNVASTWQGNLNGSADHTYSEGDAIPVRMVVSGLTAGTPCTIELRYDAMVGAIHFVDYLTDYDAYLTPDPLSGLGLTPLPSPIDYLMPQDGTLPSGNLTTYNVSSIVWVGYSSGTGGSSGVRTLTFQVTPTATTIVLAYGVHLATEFYWGAGLGASRAPGSAAKLYAAADGGADDNLQINVGAIVEKANLVITKSDSPDPVCAGGALTYTLTVQNLGPNYTTTETIVDTLPANTTYASSVPTAGTATYNSTTHQVTWLPGPLQKTAVQLTITVTLNPAAAGTTLANTAAITASTPTDYVTANNTAVEYTSVYALPTITCPGDVTVSTAPGVCYATGAQLGDPVILALAGVASLVNDAPAQFPKGTTTVTWTVTDTCSFTATCKQTVTVNDTEKPTITCPANKSVTTDPGKCYATGVALDTPTTHDNCGVASVVAARFDDKPLTEPYPVGVTTVTWTVTDTAGLTATCPQTVTVTDAEPPTIACPRPETVECSKDVPEAATDYDSLVLQGGSASDSCGGPVTVTHMGDAISSQTCLNRYTITRTYRASDPGGNYAECTQVITVDDTAQPTITCPADVTVECDESTEPDNTGNATATDNCDPTPTVTYTDWTTPAAGIITVDSHCGPWDPSVNPTFPYGRADQNAPAAMPVTPGERVFIGNATGQVRAAGDFPLTGPDGYTSDPYGPVDNKQLTPGIYCPSARTPADWPTYLVALMGTFADSSGLLVGQPFEIGTKSLLVTVPEGASQLLFGLNDDKFADNSGSFSVQVGPVSCGTTIERTWTLTDACGNSASCVQTITVQDTTAPVITTLAGALDATLECSDATGIAAALALAPTATDNCTAAPTMTLASDQTTADQDCANAYVRVRTWNFDDGCGNTSASFVQTITVQDTTAPVITVPSGALSMECYEEALVNTWAATATATDNCDSAVTVTPTWTAPADNCDETVTVTFTATDACGNVGAATKTFTVDDTIPPYFTSVPEDETIECPATPSFVMPEVEDNCDASVDITYQDTQGSCNNEAQTVPASGNGLIWDIEIRDTDLQAYQINKVLLRFQTNKGKGVTEFTLVSPSGQAVILVGPFCSNDSDCLWKSGTDAKDIYEPTFYACSDPQVYPKWVNSNTILPGPGDFEPYGALTSQNEDYLAARLAAVGVTFQGYVPCFNDLTGPMDGTWRVYSRKQDTSVGDVKYLGACLMPGQCPQEYYVTRTWTATDDCGNTATAQQTINVVDRTPPIIADLADITLEGCNPDWPTDVVTTWTDNCSQGGTLTGVAGAVVTAGCTQYRDYNFSVSDDCGNAATATTTRVTRHYDETAPVISGCPTDPIDLGSNPTTLPSCADALALVTATDSCDEAITPTCEAGPITDADTGACKFGKSQTFTVKATDACGNTSECPVTYTWREVPDVTPVITAVPNIMHGLQKFYIAVRVTELNRVDTCGPITVRIPKDIRWALDPGYDPALTTLGSTTLNNSVWTYSQDATYHIFTTSAVIPEGGFSYFGFNAKWDPRQSRGVYTVTSQIESYSGGEERIDNNADAERLRYFIY